MKNAVIYTRQSSGDEEESLSIENQLEQCRTYAKKNGIHVVEEYTDGNISGRTYPVGSEAFAEQDMEFKKYCEEKIKRRNKRYRKGLAEVIKQFENIDYVIVYDDTRLMRPLTNSFLDSYVAQLFIKNNVELITLTAGITNFSDFDKKLVSSLKNQVNDNAVKIANQKSIEGLKKLKNDGFLTNCVKCLGYKSSKKQEVEKTEDAAIVELIFKKYNEGESIGKIVQFLNQNDQKKRKWIHTYVLRALKRLIYTGRRYDDAGNLIEIKPLRGKEIVSLQDFLKARERLKKNPGAGKSYDSKRIHPLSGILHCGSCKGIMETRGTQEGKTYYNCKYNSTLKQGLSAKESCTFSFLMETCDKGELDCHDFIAYPIKEALKPLLFRAWIASKEESAANDDFKTQKKLLQQKLEEKKEKEREFLRMNIKGVLSSDQLGEAMTLLDEEKKDIARDINVINEKINDSISRNEFEEYFDILESFAFSGKVKTRRFDKDGQELRQKELDDYGYRLLALKTFRKIYVYKYHIYIVFNDMSKLLLERICFSTGRHFPRVTIKLDIKSKPYNYKFYIWQKSFLQDIHAGRSISPDDCQVQNTVHIGKNLQFIFLGVNDTRNRYIEEGLTYLDHLPES